MSQIHVFENRFRKIRATDISAWGLRRFLQLSPAIDVNCWFWTCCFYLFMHVVTFDFAIAFHQIITVQNFCTWKSIVDCGSMHWLAFVSFASLFISWFYTETNIIISTAAFAHIVPKCTIIFFRKFVALLGLNCVNICFWYQWSTSQIVVSVMAQQRWYLPKNWTLCRLYLF